MGGNHVLALRFGPDVTGWEGNCQHSNSNLSAKPPLGTQLLPGASGTAQPPIQTGIAHLTKVSSQNPALDAKLRLPCEQTVCCRLPLVTASLCLWAGGTCSPGL